MAWHFPGGQIRATGARPLDGLALTTRAHDLEEAKIGPDTSPASPTDCSARDVDKHTRHDYALLSEAGELPDRGSDKTSQCLQPVAWAGWLVVLGRWLAQAGHAEGDGR